MSPTGSPPTDSPGGHSTKPARSLERVGLSLSGGGFGGAGGMLGFASAVDLFLGSHAITDVGAVMGVSAGAVIGAHFAIGLSPHELIRAAVRPGSSDVKMPTRFAYYEPNLYEVPAALGRLGRAAFQTARRLLWRSNASGDEPESPALGLLPSAPLATRRLESVVRANLERFGTNRFGQLERRFRVVFYDLVTNQQVAAGNGPGDAEDISIIDAIMASAAIPGIFPPRHIEWDGRTLIGVDGGSAGITIDVRGADDIDLLIAYNHMGFSQPGPVKHLSAVAVLSLARQLLGNQRNLDELATYMDANPERHVWVFESPATSLASLISYSASFALARRMFRETKRWLRDNLDYFGRVLETYGVRVSTDFDRVTFDDVVAYGDAVVSRSPPGTQSPKG